MNKRNRKKIAWGLFLIAAAVLIILNALHEFIGFFPLIAMIIFVPIVVKSIRYSFGGMLILAAILGIIFDEQLGIEAITPLPLLAAAILLSIAFEILFRKKKFIHIEKCGFDDIDMDIDDMEIIEDSDTTCSVKFGAKTKYFTNENLEKAYLKCEFGALFAYFDGAALNPDGATVYVEANFAGVELYIPRHWNVQCNMSTTFGGVDEHGRNNPNPDSPTITIQGKANFAGVEIKYI